MNIDTERTTQLIRFMKQKELTDDLCNEIQDYCHDLMSLKLHKSLISNELTEDQYKILLEYYNFTEHKEHITVTSADDLYQLITSIIDCKQNIV